MLEKRKDEFVVHKQIQQVVLSPLIANTVNVSINWTIKSARVPVDLAD